MRCVVIRAVSYRGTVTPYSALSFVALMVTRSVFYFRCPEPHHNTAVCQTKDGDDGGAAQGWREGCDRDAARALRWFLHPLRPRRVGGRKRPLAPGAGPDPILGRAEGKGFMGQVRSGLSIPYRTLEPYCCSLSLLI